MHDAPLTPLAVLCCESTVQSKL